jgi:hypothetical protein
VQVALHYPHLPNCDVCEKWTVDTKHWQLTFYRGHPFPRKPNDPPPCAMCPKCDGETEKSPAQGRQSELSDKNRKTLALYWQSQAAGQDADLDALARRNLGLIHEQFRRYEIEQQQSLNRSLAILTAKGS